jgi:hypothetical protein
MYDLLTILCCTQVFRLLDWTLKVKGYQKPYYAVHVIHNIGIVALTASDLYNSFTHLNTAFYFPLNMWAVDICIALHAYHIIDYWSSLRLDDWLHHGLMIGIAIPLGLSVPAGALFGTNLFFTTGLPGAISYTLLFAERNQLLQKPIVQKYNALVHTWIRAPGCIAHATLSTAAVLSLSSSIIQLVVCLIVAVLTAWNGLYFMEQAIVARCSQ